MNAQEKAVYEKYRNTFPFPIVQFANEIGLQVFASEKMPLIM